MVIQPDPNFIAAEAFTFDVAIFDFRNETARAGREGRSQPARSGLLKGLVTVHWANGAFPYWPEFVNIVGRAQQSVHDRRGPFTVKIVNARHPITRTWRKHDG